MNELARAAASLAELAHAFASDEEVEERLGAALETLRRTLASDRCALLQTVGPVAPRLVVVPAPAPEERARLAARAEALLELLADPARGGPARAGVIEPGRAPQLAAPLVSLGELTGVVLLERAAPDYGEPELQLLAVVAAQLGAYLATLRLRADERRTSEALREAAARRAHFLTVLSHELRNPLAPMGAALEVLQRAAPGTPPADRAHAVLARQFGQLRRLVDDLLDVTRIATGKARVERRRLDLARVLVEAVEDQRGVFAERGVALELRREAGPLWVEGDAARLAQVVGNLLGNAAKFTPRGGRVEVEVGAEGDAAVLRVRDDGAGIPGELLQRIFEPFEQGDETLARSRGGLGLGLALSRGLVELHQGTIAARSDGPGRGAEFTVRLPLAAAGALAEAAPASPRASPRRMLVVEDSSDAAETMRDLLELAGHEVAVAGDGPTALALAERFDPEVVLCDLGLPGMSGFELARALRARRGGRPLRLLALTGYGGEEARREVREAGFDAHLVKPVPPEALEAALAPAPAAAPGWDASAAPGPVTS